MPSGFDDESELNRAPLPPDDRLWRHPSELAVGSAALLTAAALTQPHGQPIRRPVLVGGISVVTLIGLTLLVAAWLNPSPSRNALLADTRTQPSKGWLGVRLQATDRGLRVTGTEPGSPAAAALAVDDLIIGVNGEATLTIKALNARIAHLPEGGVVTVQLVRDDEPLTLSLALAAQT